MELELELSILIVIFATASGSPLPLFLLGGVATYIATFLICLESNIIVIVPHLVQYSKIYQYFLCPAHVKKLFLWQFHKICLFRIS